MKQASTTQTNTRKWVAPTVRHVGSVGQVIQNGGGKVTVLTGDPGEPNKVPSGE